MKKDKQATQTSHNRENVKNVTGERKVVLKQIGDRALGRGKESNRSRGIWWGTRRRQIIKARH